MQTRVSLEDLRFRLFIDDALCTRSVLNDDSLIFVGDPRLNPAATWYGVHFHNNQPICNEWKQWAGEDDLFDISANKLKPVSKATEVKSRHNTKKRYFCC